MCNSFEVCRFSLHAENKKGSHPLPFLLIFVNFLHNLTSELCIVRGTWERYNVPDIAHTGYKLHHSFKAKSEATMRG